MVSAIPTLRWIESAVNASERATGTSRARDVKIRVESRQHLTDGHRAETKHTKRSGSIYAIGAFPMCLSGRKMLVQFKGNIQAVLFNVT